MFDIGWTELVVIAGVAIIVVGPKDLPGMLRTFGKTMGQIRRTANDFKRQLDDALKEAEQQAGLEETRKSLQSISKMDPLAGVKKDVEAAANRTGQKPAAETVPSALAPAEEEASPSAEPASGEAAVTEPTEDVDDRPAPAEEKVQDVASSKDDGAAEEAPDNRGGSPRTSDAA
ncbi:Sec-independent protein translocase protein TatB [Afifella marina]|uniref:Sec-independent protein translocase protein TatB n=1 Tax=Afifella marina DSM 2698 TaxID=1120955 RepID=A0A1G5P906_AFIMA|nr:Sec-independent protein translocase protein TatB [Afifella marina]MBK1624908.1 twin-arginine translocase subunit TatB [Afifella marina DSM 2698]MBK1628502.1 twin-arginine translocase subunit TatB [Afifella marina]MBK5917989.1 twin-arginine translocase subunit TatB [Afifella marina]RAI18677.1 twin-arginine translocase subunit TatB [Afifella marina DSM 2698]SCZ45480.1 sec-independent protein translocase protein TatB [Afifella marina DSM 2698]